MSDEPDRTAEPEWVLASFGEKLRHRRWIALAAALCWISILIAGVVILLTPPRYRASAILKIAAESPYVVFESEPPAPGKDRFVETQIELMRSPMVLEVLLANPEIANGPGVAKSKDRLATLRDALQIERIADSELFNVTFTSPSPRLAAAIANAIIVEYLKIQSRVGMERYQRVADLLDDERRRRQIDVEELKKKVISLAADVTGHDPFGLGVTLDVRAASDGLAEIYRRLVNLEIDRALLSAEIEAVKAHDSASEVEPSSAGDVQSSAESAASKLTWRQAVADLRASLEALVASDDSLRASPAYESLTSNVARVDQEFQKLAATPATDAPESTAHAVPNAELAELERRLQRIDRERQVLQEHFRMAAARAQAGNSKAVALTFARAELEREERVFEAIAQRKLAMQTESRAPARVNIEQKAAIPLVPVQPLSLWHDRIAIGCAVLAVLGLILTVATVQPMPRLVIEGDAAK
jgi:capsular polysaccharide biosynthesis protein